MSQLYSDGYSRMLDETLDRSQAISPSTPGVLCPYREPDPLGGVIVFSGQGDAESPDNMGPPYPVVPTVHRRADQSVFVQSTTDPVAQQIRSLEMGRKVVCTNPGALCDYHGTPVHVRQLSMQVTTVTSTRIIPAASTPSTPSATPSIISIDLLDVLSDTTVTNPDGSTTETIQYSDGSTMTIHTVITYQPANVALAGTTSTTENTTQNPNESIAVTSVNTSYAQVSSGYVLTPTCMRYEFERLGMDPETGIDYPPVDTHGQVFGFGNLSNFGWS